MPSSMVEDWMMRSRASFPAASGCLDQEHQHVLPAWWRRGYHDELVATLAAAGVGVHVTGVVAVVVRFAGRVLAACGEVVGVEQLLRGVLRGQLPGGAHGRPRLLVP